MKNITKIIALLFVMFTVSMAYSPSLLSFSADDAIQDLDLENRALKLHDELRCPVCKGQAISDSNAELARDLRRIVRERVVLGDTDEEVMTYLSERYGDFVLLRPRIKPTNYVLWFGPIIVFLVGAIGLWFFVMKSRKKGAPMLPTELSQNEKERLKALRIDDPK